MFHLPPVPAWDALHPLIVHFPIALLFVAPLFVVLGMVFGRRGRPLFYSALLLMMLGTGSLFLAGETGEAAAKAADRTVSVERAIDEHEELAESTQVTFSVLTGIFLVMLLVPLLRRREPGPGTALVVPIVFLVLYGGGMVVLANTAHHGGRLVHQFGVHAKIAPVTDTPTAVGSTVRDTRTN